MTYMFEYQEYIDIPLKLEIRKMYPKYRLYLYGEGKYASDLRNGDIRGIPVLFIPGNAGSYKQVRSLGSVALRMAQSLHTTFHFNFFTVDLNEELSGLYGGVLKAQTAFVHECINRIQKIYSYRTPDVKIILIGHSMGGVIARSLFQLRGFPSSVASLIITKATPHAGPVVILDPHIAEFYDEMNKWWQLVRSSALKNVPVISIGGGDRDVLIRSDLTVLPISHQQPVDINILTTAIPEVWVSTDHLCIVWCKQLVLTVVRALFDLIDSRKKEITKDLELQQRILSYHFIRRPTGKHFLKFPFIPHVTFTAQGEWIVITEMSWRFSRNKVISSIYLMIPLLDGEVFLVAGSGLAKDDWIFACNPTSYGNNSTTCLQGENLSDSAEIIPSKIVSSQRKLIQVSGSGLSLKGHSHLIVHVSPSREQVDILGEHYRPSFRHRVVSLPSLYRGLTSFSPTKILTIPLTESTIFYNLTLGGLGWMWQSCTLILETRICRSGTKLGQGMLKLIVPWSQEDRHVHVRTKLGGLTHFPIKIHVPRPPSILGSAQLHTILDPECSYALFVQFPYADVTSQFFKNYGLYIPGYTIALILAALSHQLHVSGTTGLCPPLFQTMTRFSTFFSTAVLPTLLYYTVWKSGFVNVWMPDDDHLQEKGLHFPLFRVILFFVAYGILGAVTLIVWALVTLLGSLWIWIRHRTVLNAVSHPSSPSSMLSKFPALLCSILAACAVVITGSLALAIGYIFHFIRLVLLCGRSRAEEDRRGKTVQTRRWHFHLTLAILWLWSSMIATPSLIVWFKGMHQSLHLHNDPHLLNAVMMALTSFILWQPSCPSGNRYYTGISSYLVCCIAVITAMYGLVHLYYTLHFITTVFVAISLQQLAAICSRPLIGKQD